MSGYTIFGFGPNAESNAGPANQGGASLAKLRIERPVTTTDGLNFSLDTLYPIVPGSLTVYKNGLRATKGVGKDYVEGSDGKSFRWINPQEPLNLNADDVTTDFVES
jgi:hypothetical protein